MNSTLMWTSAAVAVLIAAVLILRKKIPLGPAVPESLQTGKPLPEFSAVKEDGSTVKTSELRGKPAVLLFVRGNWCPFCTKQVETLTEHYKSIVSAGASLIFITPKPLETTRRVAEFFEVEFDFWLDESLSIARSLGLVMEHGVPDDYAKEYGKDTVWPAALIVDKDGVIRYSKLARYIFNRPNPESLLSEVRKL